jgi:hypothetical protein
LLPLLFLPSFLISLFLCSSASRKCAQKQVLPPCEVLTALLNPPACCSLLRLFAPFPVCTGWVPPLPASAPSVPALKPVYSNSSWRDAEACNSQPVDRTTASSSQTRHLLNKNGLRK